MFNYGLPLNSKFNKKKKFGPSDGGGDSTGGRSSGPGGDRKMIMSDGSLTRKGIIGDGKETFTEEGMFMFMIMFMNPLPRAAYFLSYRCS